MAAVDGVVETFGKIDVLVDNATRPVAVGIKFPAR